MSAEKETSGAVGFTPGPREMSFDEYEGHVISMGSRLEDESNHESHHVIEYGHSLYPEDGQQFAEAEANARLITAAPDLYEALSDLVEIIDKAGISNLANGVQLGQMSWAVKAGDRMRWAKTCLAKAAPPSQESANPSPPHASPLQGASAPLTKGE